MAYHYSVGNLQHLQALCEEAWLNAVVHENIIFLFVTV
jgi:hypothetical protein